MHSEIEETNVTVDSISNPDINFIPSLKSLSIVEGYKSYKEVKSEIEEERLALQSLDLEQDSISILFRMALVNRIIPFWAGTEWSFGGHTSEPKSGYIACGYFVSTTLQDIGLNMNRYKLAQQSPLYEAKSLAVGTIIHEVSENSMFDNIAAIDSIVDPGIHFIGFDQSHVGFLYKDDYDLYMIHSNYMDPSVVEIETLVESEVFQSFSKYYIVELSTNKEMMRRWINGNRIEVKIES